jgi:Fe-S-cluster-containing hydrogenase component 2
MTKDRKQGSYPQQEKCIGCWTCVWYAHGALIMDKEDKVVTKCDPAKKLSQHVLLIAQTKRWYSRR